MFPESKHLKQRVTSLFQTHEWAGNTSSQEAKANTQSEGNAKGIDVKDKEDKQCEDVANDGLTSWTLPMPKSLKKNEPYRKTNTQRKT